MGTSECKLRNIARETRDSAGRMERDSRNPRHHVLYFSPAPCCICRDDILNIGIGLTEKDYMWAAQVIVQASTARHVQRNRSQATTTVSCSRLSPSTGSRASGSPLPRPRRIGFGGRVSAATETTHDPLIPHPPPLACSCLCVVYISFIFPISVPHCVFRCVCQV